MHSKLDAVHRIVDMLILLTLMGILILVLYVGVDIVARTG